VHDLVVHPRDGDLVAGTHGRSIWILDDPTPLQQLNAEVRERELHLFVPRPARQWPQVNLGRKQPDFLFRGENPPAGALLHAWTKSAGKLQVEVRDPQRDRLWKAEVAAEPGLVRVAWPLEFPPSDAERAETRTRLAAAVATLRAEVRGDRQLERLAALGEDIGEARGERQLNRLRAALVEEFGRFAGGRMLFGERLRPSHAAPGDYHVRVRMGARAVDGAVTVRGG
jgi:hypothetical protein